MKITPLLDLFYPPRCAFCSAFVQGRGNHFPLCCPKCTTDLPYLSEKDKRQTGAFFRLAIAPFSYEGLVQESLHRFKFRGGRHLAESYGPILAQCILELSPGPFDLVSWIPVSRKRYKNRGYDQAQLLALETAKYLHTQAVPLLEKVRDVPPQSSLGGLDQRQANIKDAYAMLPGAQPVLDKKILLIDDVCTTGATLSEAASVLLRAGCEEVLCATLAKTIIKTASEV